MKNQFYANVVKITLFATVLIFIIFTIIGIPFIETAGTIFVLLIISLVAVSWYTRKINKKIQFENEMRLKNEEAEREAKSKARGEKEQAVKDQLLSSKSYKPSAVITVCNFKKKIVWSDELKTILDVSREIFHKSYDDKELYKTYKFFISILDFIEKSKTEETDYAGEQKIKKDINDCINLAKS